MNPKGVLYPGLDDGVVTVVEDCRVAMVPQRHYTVVVLTGAIERAGISSNIVRLFRSHLRTGVGRSL